MLQGRFSRTLSDGLSDFAERPTSSIVSEIRSPENFLSVKTARGPGETTIEHHRQEESIDEIR